MSLYIRKEFQSLQQAIDSGSIWSMEGAAGRFAMDAMERGEVVLGRVSHRDFWGNRVPSRYEVKRGTLGSIGYARKQRDWANG